MIYKYNNETGLCEKMDKEEINNLIELNEGANDKAIDNVESGATLFYTHVLKWVYQKHKQSPSWVRSINNGIQLIENNIYRDKKKKNINTIVTRDSDLEKSYEAGLRKARDDTKMLINDRYEDTKKYVWTNFDSIDKIIDRESVREFLKSQHYNEESDTIVDEELDG